MRAWIPAALVGLFAFWCGTFHGGTGAWASTVAYGLLLVLSATFRPDPSLFGSPFRRGLGVLLGVLILGSWWASPVSRAGRTVLLLLPAFFLLPGALAACWGSEAARRRGLAALSAVVAAGSCWALIDRFWAGSERAALPLGHHNLLAVWIVTLLPLAALGARGEGWALGRGLAVAAALSGAAALVATGSLAGTLAFAVEISLAALLLSPSGKSKRWLVSGGLFLTLALLPLVPRLRGLLGGGDASWLARQSYLAAGWEGLLARPLLGWGPGSTPWTVAELIQPLPGVQPPGELVADLHNLPLQLGYEVGVPAALLCLGIFAATLLRRGAEAKDPPMAAAAKLGCLGFAVASLGGASLSVLALPVALAVALAALASAAPPQGSLPGPLPGSPAGTPTGRWKGLRRAPAVYAFGALLALLPTQGAHHAYEAASTSEDPLPGLEKALNWDPGFPLYRARHAAWTGDPEQALEAAQGAPGVAAHWLLAAALSLEEEASRPAAGRSPGATEALLATCRLDPLSGLAPFLFATSGSPASVELPTARSAETAAETTAEAVARALLAEPRLLAAPWLRGNRELLEAAVERIRRQPGVEEGLRERWVEIASKLPPTPSTGAAGSRSRLAQTCDGRPGLALSTFLFRRRPWPLTLASVEVDAALAAWIDLPPASGLRTTAPWAFTGAECGLGRP